MSANGYFDELEDSSELNPLETEAFAELDPGKNTDLETFDAFNTDTFDCALEGDWEAEHDKLLELEGNDNLNNTLTKFDNAEDDDDLKRDEELENGADYLNGYTQTSGSNIRLDTNTIKQINQKSNLFSNNNQSNVKLSNQDNRSLIAEQLKLFSQLQLQQQQQQQFHKSQQLMQQAQKQYQQQQLNSAMLAAAALSARNNQMQLQQNMMQKQQFNVMQNNSSSNIISNDSNRKTPISFTNNYNTMQANDKENSMYSYANQSINQTTFKNNENDSIKLKNLLEKINQVNLNPNRPASNEPINQRRESPVQKQPIDSSIIQSILQSQNQYASVNNANVTSPPNLPKLPAMKVKTLEEIENELLNQSQVNKPSNQTYSRNLQSDMQEMNQARNQQQQQPDMSKFFPLINTTTNNPNSPNDMADKQKKLLEAIALHQYQQQLLKYQQHQQQQQQNFQQNQQNPIMNQPINSNPNVDQQLQQQLVLIQQQLMSSQLNLNALLPPNFPTLNQQQKQMVLNQIQRNLQTSLLQQQLLQQQQQNGQLQRLEDQNKGFNNNNDLNNNSNHNEMNKFNNNNGDFNKRNMNNNNMNLNMNNMNHRQQQQQNNQNRNDRDRKKQHNNNTNMRNNNGNNNNNNNNGDKLAGMMTDKEKNWVVNVQMLQLQIDDPYRYDYYYTAWMLKKKQFSMRNNNSAGLKTSVLYQLMNKQDPKNYRPLTFENSLGKVTMSNFHHPRALIDLNQRDNDQHESLVAHIDGLDEDEEKQKEAKNKDTILLEIEKIYQVLLSIDEIEHSILKAPEEMRILLFQERRAKVDKLALMLCTENFPHYLFVEKGRRLLAKSIPIFNLPQAKLILGFFMQYIYIISKNNIALDEIYSHISFAIDTQKFTDLVEIVNQFVHLYSRQPVTVYNTIFSNKFSLTFLLKFMSKSELINQDDYDSDIKAIWSCYLNLVLAGLTIINPVTIKPDGNSLWNISEVNQLNIKAILDNFSVDNDLWSKNEMKLKELFAII